MIALLGALCIAGGGAPRVLAARHVVLEKPARLSISGKQREVREGMVVRLQSRGLEALFVPMNISDAWVALDNSACTLLSTPIFHEELEAFCPLPARDGSFLWIAPRGLLPQMSSAVEVAAARARNSSAGCLIRREDVGGKVEHVTDLAGIR